MQTINLVLATIFEIVSIWHLGGMGVWQSGSIVRNVLGENTTTAIRQECLTRTYSLPEILSTSTL